MLLLMLSHFSRIQLCVTPQTAAHQDPLSLGFSRQEHWSGLPFPSPLCLPFCPASWEPHRAIATSRQPFGGYWVCPWEPPWTLCWKGLPGNVLAIQTAEWSWVSADSADGVGAGPRVSWHLSPAADLLCHPVSPRPTWWVPSGNRGQMSLRDSSCCGLFFFAKRQ